MIPQFKLRKEFRFEAAHRLDHHDGKCARLHGHSWLLIVEIVGDRLQALELPEGRNPKGNMILDYSDIKGIVQPLVEDKLDHHFLNETFGSDSPTSEFIAKEIYAWLSPRLGGALKAIEINETCTSACRYELIDPIGDLAYATAKEHEDKPPLKIRRRGEDEY